MCFLRRSATPPFLPNLKLFFPFFFPFFLPVGSKRQHRPLGGLNRCPLLKQKRHFLFNKYGGAAPWARPLWPVGVHLAVEPARPLFFVVFFPLPRRLSGAVVIVRAGGRVHVGRGRVHVVVVRVSPDAGQRVGRRPGLGAQVVFVGAGVLVGVVVQGVGGQRVGLGPQVVGRAGPPAAQRHGMEAPRDGQGGAEHAGHELVGGVGVDGRGPGVTLVLSPAVLCVQGGETEVSAKTHIRSLMHKEPIVQIYLS